MQDSSKKYQLRRMVLVNAGTNLHVPSGRIAAIDPRGGAAVLGDNGVGKTTTLRILPLFFGHLPSQIVAAGQGQEAMIRFVLPTDASAIAFEYQRGSDCEDDIRLAVVRRRSDDPNVPFYRFYKGSFRKDLFVDEGRFLADDETQLKATSLGIATTSKLTTAEYRCVILKAPSTAKDRERLRRYSQDWSFGPQQLDNLDRLVAAMVKKHINFSDIVQVAVGLVQHDLGQGSERAKLTFRQGRGPIERWLRNRDACEDAFKLAPKVAELEDDLKDHRSAEARFRGRRADVAAIRVARESEHAELDPAIADMKATRVREIAVSEREHDAQRAVTSQTHSTASKAKIDFEEAQGMARHFEEACASRWERRLEKLPALRWNLQTLGQQVDVAEATHADAIAKYAQMEQDIHSAAITQALALEKSKEPHRARKTQAFEQIAAAESTARTDSENELAERRNQLAETLEPFVEQRGTWEARRSAPATSGTALRDLGAANDALQKHTEDLSTVRGVHTRAESIDRDARRAFTSCEEEVRDAKAGLESAERTLEAARTRGTPAPGTLHAALRARGDDHWKRTLAKVLDPALLERDDLEPTWLEEAADTVYGLSLNVGVIATAEWSDDALAKQGVESAEVDVARAQAVLASLQSKLPIRSEAISNAKQAVEIAQARLSVLDTQTDTLKLAVSAAKLKCDTERRDAVAEATAELNRLRNSIDEIKKQQAGLSRRQDDERAAIKTTHDQLRAEATRMHDEALEAVVVHMKRLDSDLKKTLRDIASQRDEHLGQAGVDVERLAVLRKRVARIRAQVRLHEDREPLVFRWGEWVAAGGATTVETLKAAAQRAVEAARLQTDALESLVRKIDKATSDHATALAKQEKRLDDVQEEIRLLTELDDAFGDYQASGTSVIDTTTTAKVMRGKVHAEREALNKLSDGIHRNALSIRQSLTVKDTAIKELVEATLAPMAESSDIRRAAELCGCYKLIGPQVVNDVNLTLKALLVNIGAFHKALHSFQKEVSAFNKRLLAGLDDVQCFERVKDLRLDIVTNFDSLGFYKKLTRMEEIVRQHSTEYGKDYTRDLPSDETARALGDFVSVLGNDGSLEVNLSSHITLQGSVSDNGQHKVFKRASELENISSEGLTSLILITLMTALLNTVRGTAPVHVPWVTDEVGKFDPKNFRALMQKLRDNRIDVVTASPELGPAQQAMFAKRYLFEDRGRILEYQPPGGPTESSQSPAPEEVTQ